MPPRVAEHILHGRAAAIHYHSERRPESVPLIRFHTDHRPVLPRERGLQDSELLLLAAVREVFEIVHLAEQTIGFQAFPVLLGR